MNEARIDWITNAHCHNGIALPANVKNAIREALRESDSERRLNEDTVTRLKLLCRMLGLEDAFSDQLYADPGALFSIFGCMRIAIENMANKSRD